MFAREYFNYVKDNPHGFWFKNRLYGWGWVPAKWQGWLVTALFIIFLILNSYSLAIEEPDRIDLQWFFFRLIMAVATLMLICFKTGEKPHWQWGKPKA